MAYASEAADQVQSLIRLRNNRLTMFFGIAAIVFIIAAGWPKPWNPVRQWGLGLLAISLVFWSIARWQIGSSLTRRPEAHRLVTRGIYARIRNPIYFFGVLTAVGIFLFLDLPVVAFLFALIVVPIQLLRAERERKVLAAAFGDEYKKYRERTWF